ncbi:hypothetical protein G7046_g4807 [Stylonectria norvegica]|nr:hypothetical protein G7046_g4807 [Stylonectria norvegica]
MRPGVLLGAASTQSDLEPDAKAHLSHGRLGREVPLITPSEPALGSLELRLMERCGSGSSVARRPPSSGVPLTGTRLQHQQPRAPPRTFDTSPSHPLSTTPAKLPRKSLLAVALSKLVSVGKSSFAPLNRSVLAAIDSCIDALHAQTLKHATLRPHPCEQATVAPVFYPELNRCSPFPSLLAVSAGSRNETQLRHLKPRVGPRYWIIAPSPSLAHERVLSDRTPFTSDPRELATSSTPSRRCRRLFKLPSIMPSLSSRFELPALNLNFGSITDGTNIPPPPLSPVQKVPTPPQTPPLVKPAEKTSMLDSVNGGNEGRFGTKPAPINGNLAGTKRSADDEAPLSPAASSRQGSIRRLFSRTMLNNSYAEGQLSSTNGTATPASVSAPAASLSRPVSQSGTSFMDERKSKRSSGWFRRLRSGDQVQQQSPKRTSMIYEEPQPTPTIKKPSGPPPPMIPELTDFTKDEGSLGNDLFKNIK